MNKNSNTLKDLLTESELELYNKTEYPFNLSIVHGALLSKLKKDPTYEVWLPLVYYKFVPFMKKENTVSLVQPYNVFISNKGVICSLRKDPPQIMNPWVGTHGYLTFSLPTDYVNTGLLVHRALACTFLKVEIDGHPKDLQPNHIDGIKVNCSIDNLEWSTFSGNISHAYKNGLRTALPKGEKHFKTNPVKGTVLYGKFKGLQFLLLGNSDKLSHGFTPSGISNCCKGTILSHRYCSWEFATQDEMVTVQKGLPIEILDDFNFLDKYGTTVIEVTKIKTGEVFTIPSTLLEIEKAGFYPKGVFAVLAGTKKSHLSCTFKRKNR